MLEVTATDPSALSSTVSRRRYMREQSARLEAEKLLDVRSRALWEANEKLTEQAAVLEHKVLERTADLEKAMQAAEASNQAKSVFLASMSHEIRTPLNGVLGMAEALKDSPLNVEQQEMAGTIVESGNILLSVLNDILDISKIEAGQMEIEQTAFDITALFKATKQLFEFKALEKKLSITCSVAPAAQTWVTGDPVRLRQVVGNLVSNAVKFTSAGGVDISVDLKEGTDLYVEVRDSGLGIPEDRMTELFKPFQQLDASVNRRFGGTGLGLSISRHICNLMGGEIRVQSTVGEGSTFTAHVRVTPATAVASTERENTDADTAILMSRPWRILLAEDNKTNQLVFRKLVKAFPWEISLAPDGEKAVRAVADSTFDLILMDINMPHMDGVEATTQIRAYETTHGRQPAHIIALTANSMVHQIEGYISAGMNGHLAKPLKKDTLLSTIANALTAVAAADPA